MENMLVVSVDIHCAVENGYSCSLFPSAIMDMFGIFVGLTYDVGSFQVCAGINQLLTGVRDFLAGTRDI